MGLALVAVCAMSAIAAASASASSTEKTPLGIYKNCPVNVYVPGSNTGHAEECLVGKTLGGPEGGYFKVGSVTVPLLKAVVLQGGTWENEETGALTWIPPENGQNIVPTPEKVPSEPLGNVTTAQEEAAGWPESLKQSYAAARKRGWLKDNKISEQIETAGTPLVSENNILEEEGVGVHVLLRIQGINKWLTSLGGSCFIGSTADPIVQNLTTGGSISPLTGEELHGAAGVLNILDGGRALSIENDLLVDNTYAVPAAENCGGSEYEAYLDPVVDEAFGLPAVAGASETKLVGTLFQAAATFIKSKGI
jgi:hypothetical protein